MKKTFTLFFAILSALVYSQPEISQANLPLIGDHVVIGICSDLVEPGDGGAMQTWDMSNLTETEEQFFTYITPSEGLLSDSFPSATICAVSWQNDYSYYKISSSALSVVGHVVTYEDTSLLVYNDMEQILSLPYTYNDNFIDTFDGNSHISGLGTFAFDGSLDFEADGYGTLILPNATYENVVRYHFYREQTNYFGGFPAGTTTKDQWAWVSADKRFWLLMMEEVFDGISTTPLIWYDKNPYSATTGYHSYNKSSIPAYPNPLHSSERLTINWDKSESAIVSLLHLDGSLIHEQQIQMRVGSNYCDFIKTISGMYILKVESNSTYITQKISILD